MASVDASLQQVDTTQRYALGARHFQDASADPGVGNANAGVRIWVYVKADGVTLPVGSPCILASGEGNYECTLTTTAVIAPAVVGVAQHEIASGKYGWILAHGKGTVKAGGAISAFDALTTGASNGVIAISSNAQCVIGYAPSAISSGATGSAFINCIR